MEDVFWEVPPTPMERQGIEHLISVVGQLYHVKVIEVARHVQAWVVLEINRRLLVSQ